MSETYDSRRKRWLQIKETLPEGLRERIPLRNVQDAARLPLEAQHTLGQALKGGLKQIPTAIKMLEGKPSTSVADLLAISPVRKLNDHSKRATPAYYPISLPGSQVDECDVQTLAALFRSVSPGANPISAEFWAREKPALLAIVRAQRDFFDANASEVDFVVFCAWLLQLFRVADQRIAAQAAYHNALNHFSLTLDGRLP